MSSSSSKVLGNQRYQEKRRGVRQRGSNGKWTCEVRHPKTKLKIWLGSYPTAEMAARARDVAEIAFKEHLARLNYVDSWWCLPSPASSDVVDVRKAAIEAAEAFRPKVEGAAEPAIVEYVDEEVFGSHESKLDDMAQGMMLAPPPWYKLDTDVETQMTSLWSFIA